MPIYEYTCEDCKNTFETLVLNSAEKVTCPGCHGSHLHKLISAHAVGRPGSGPACGSGMPCGDCPAMQ